MMNRHLRIVVVEDEMIIAESISRSLLSLGHMVIGTATNFTSAIELIGNSKPDLVLIDIRLSGSKDGIDLANEINALFDIPFIFTTSNSNPSIIERAKKTHPAAYLLKPFSKANLYSTIEVAYENQMKLKELTKGEKLPINDFILVNHKKAFVKVHFDDILFIRSQHVYIEINTVHNKKFLVRTSLKEYLHLLPLFFRRIHRSYAVNIHFIEKIINQSVMLKDNVVIPVSKEYKRGLAEALNKS